MQKHRLMSRRAVLAAAAATLLATASAASAQDAFVKFYSGTGAIGGFHHGASADLFYQANFSPNAGFTRWSFNGATWNPTTLVGPTDQQTFGQSSSLSGNGTIPALAGGGSSTMGDLILNPQPLTITREGAAVNYPAGSIGFVIDQATNVTAGGTTRYDLTKTGYFYDLRQIGAATGGAGIDRNANGTVEWNDVFEPLFTKADMRTVAGYVGTGSGILARHFAFSSNGQSVYFVDSSQSSITGGLWRANLTTPGAAGLSRILTPATSTNVEPSVVASTVRNFGGGAGDQVIIKGEANFAANPNGGGVSYVVDDGTTVSGPQTLLSGKQIQGFLEAPGLASVFSTAADAAGNLYIFSSAEDGVFKYDTAGRLSKVFSRAEQIVFDTTTAASTNSVATTADMKVRDSSFTGAGGAFAVQQLLYSNTSSGVRSPVGVYLFKPGDFNRDNAVDAADIALFKGKLALRGVVAAGVGASSPFTQTNAADLKFDLNGSITVSQVAGVAIDWKDVKIFQQFAGLSDGDVDMDFDVDGDDLNAVATNYNAGGKIFTQGNLTSVRIDALDRDEVNFADLVTLAANWTAAKPALGAVGSIPQADLDRAFAITTAGAISQYQGSGGADTWSNAASWSGAGVPNAVGAVASLLTKPQNDVNLNVDGNYTVGQLNFDNYFSYALTGGTLTFQGANGSAAEINTFAASPSIAAGVAFASNTNINVTDTQDTLALSGAVSSAAGVAINKQGAGALAISGPQAHGAGAALNAIAGTTRFDSDGGTNLSVNVAAAVDFNVSQNLASVSVTGGGVATLAANGTHVLRTASLNVTGTGKLDLRDNKLIVDSGVLGTWNGSAYTGITGLIDSGRGNAPDAMWDGAGIVTSDARAIETGNRAAIGIARAGDLGRTTFAGQDVGSDDVIAMLTWGGDTTLDGKVNIDDYGRIDANVASSGTVFGWFNGDFNYDGKINIDDYGIIDGSIADQGAPFPTSARLVQGVVAVPEPSAVACLISGTAGVLLRRARRR